MQAAALFLLLGACGAGGAGAASPVRGEYEIKAAFVFNFMKFVEWPAAALAPDENLRVCVAGETAVGERFQDLEGQLIGAHRLRVAHPRSYGAFRACHVLFIAVTEEDRLPDILGALDDANVLTIGDSKGLARKDVMISFYREGKNMRFEINVEAARRAGITISSKLLRLAGTVYGIEPLRE